jgi:hypothetical protein
MATDTAKSQSIISLDSTPIVPITAGQGAATHTNMVQDQAAATSTGLQSTASTYRIIRFPTGSIPISMELATDSYLDSHSTPGLVMDLNIAFSDSTVDGTPSWYQGLIPNTGNTGGTTTVGSYVAPNLIFGQLTWPTADEALAYPLTNLLLNGSRTNYPMFSLLQQPLWQTFGFVDGRSNPADPNGYFDLLIYISTAASIGHAGNILARLSYATT